MPENPIRASVVDGARAFREWAAAHDVIVRPRGIDPWVPPPIVWSQPEEEDSDA